MCVCALPAAQQQHMQRGERSERQRAADRVELHPGGCHASNARREGRGEAKMTDVTWQCPCKGHSLARGGWPIHGGLTLFQPMAGKKNNSNIEPSLKYLISFVQQFFRGERI